MGTLKNYTNILTGCKNRRKMTRESENDADRRYHENKLCGQW